MALKERRKWSCMQRGLRSEMLASLLQVRRLVQVVDGSLPAAVPPKGGKKAKGRGRGLTPQAQEWVFQRNALPLVRGGAGLILSLGPLVLTLQRSRETSFLYLAFLRCANCTVWAVVPNNGFDRKRQHLCRRSTSSRGAELDEWFFTEIWIQFWSRSHATGGSGPDYAFIPRCGFQGQCSLTTTGSSPSGAAPWQGGVWCFIRADQFLASTLSASPCQVPWMASLTLWILFLRRPVKSWHVFSFTSLTRRRLDW